MDQYIAIIFALTLGLCVGSFLNVLIYRLPLQKSVIHPASACPNCGIPIRWYDNIPVLSYLLLRGKCRHCQSRISLRYPIVELVTGLLSLAIFFRYGVSWACLFYFIFISALIAIIFIDFDHQIIPDVITYPGIVTGFISSLILPNITYSDSLIGIILGGGILYLIALGYLMLAKREGMGGGDIKLLSMIGAFLGWQALPFTILVSALLGSVVGIIAMLKTGKDAKMAIPFGPFLSIGAILYLFWGKAVTQWYLGLLC
ncbi:MAG: prepilin peptidase [Deltaproteobacteria bacterium]|nr:MAG: prepilin peptidase [Deltaproteobacteria bacterium]